MGGSKMLAAAVDKNGQILKKIRYKTPESLDEGLESLHKIITEVAEGKKIVSIGAAIGGPLDWENGIVSPLHQPAWRNVPLKDIIQSRWHCPFFVDVDTNVAALGEYVLGGFESSRFLYITISTGVGGGFLVDGQIYRGQNGIHPEIAHQSIPAKCKYPERIKCECGIQDCLEAIVSGNGIRRVYQKTPEELNQEEWLEVAYNLGQGLRNIAAILAPEAIVFGGGITIGAGKKFIHEAEKVMRENLRIVNPPQIVISQLGYDTALYGATVIAKRGLEA